MSRMTTHAMQVVQLCRDHDQPASGRRSSFDLGTAARTHGGAA